MVIRVLCSKGHFRDPASHCFKAKLSVKPFTFILLQKRLIFTRKVFRFASLWNWEFLELENDLINGQRLVAQLRDSIPLRRDHKMNGSLGETGARVVTFSTPEW